MDYRKDTLNAYRSAERAAEYQKYHTRDWSWGRVATAREQRLLARELSRYSWTADDRLLDIPCGTGITGNILRVFPFRIFAGDISMEMMGLARAEYPSDKLVSLAQTDITRTGFAGESFACILVLGFLHRVPLEIKRASLREIFRLTRHVAIVTCSVDNPVQRTKKSIFSVFGRRHVTAPCPEKVENIVHECESAGFRVVKKLMVAPLLSSESMLVLEKP